MSGVQDDLFAEADRQPQTCPHCGTVEPNGFLLRNNHWPDPNKALCVAQLLVINHIWSAQDGLGGRVDVPWGTFDVLFIGGSTGWKLGPNPILLAGEARRRGVPVHVGRVNSKKRWDHCDRWVKADTADGTFLAFGPKINLPKLLSWF